MSAPTEHVAAVGRFYDEHHESFLRVYGTVIQAFRTRDPRQLLDHEARAMGLKPGVRLLDAGCGVAGPAIHFALEHGALVDAITISARQAEDARRAVDAAGCADRVRITLGDYHALAELYPPGHFDAVCFLESFGHSRDKARLLEACWHALRPGGTLYVKDLFAKEPALPEHGPAIRAEIARIDTAYHYAIADLYDVLRTLRGLGFILQDLRAVDIPLEDFENLTLSNDFQELTGIARIEDWTRYIFPVEFFELTCLKPWYEKGAGSSRYFLQNLYHLRVLGKTPSQL